MRRLIDGEPVSDRYLLGLAWEIKSLRDEAMIGDPSRPNLDRPVNEATPIEARRALVKQIARQVLDLCRAHARDEVDEATTLGVLQSWLSDFARDTGEIRERWKLAKETRTGADLIAAFQASPHRDIDIEPERYHERGAKPKP